MSKEEEKNETLIFDYPSSELILTSEMLSSLLSSEEEEVNWRWKEEEEKKSHNRNYNEYGGVDISPVTSSYQFAEPADRVASTSRGMGTLVLIHVCIAGNTLWNEILSSLEHSLPVYNITDFMRSTGALTQAGFNRQAWTNARYRLGSHFSRFLNGEGLVKVVKSSGISTTVNDLITNINIPIKVDLYISREDSGLISPAQDPPPARNQGLRDRTLAASVPRRTEWSTGDAAHIISELASATSDEGFHWRPVTRPVARWFRDLPLLSYRRASGHNSLQAATIGLALREILTVPPTDWTGSTVNRLLDEEIPF